MTDVWLMWVIHWDTNGILVHFEVGKVSSCARFWICLNCGFLCLCVCSAYRDYRDHWSQSTDYWTQPMWPMPRWNRLDSEFLLPFQWWIQQFASKRNFDIQRNLGISAQIAIRLPSEKTTSPQIAVLVFAALPPWHPPELPLQRDFQGPGPAVSAAVGLPWAEKVGASDQGVSVV